MTKQKIAANAARGYNVRGELSFLKLRIKVNAVEFC